MVQFLKSAAKYLQQRLPLKNKFLFNIQCLKPSNRRNPETNDMIKGLAVSLPHINEELSFLDSVATESLLDFAP